MARSLTTLITDIQRRAFDPLGRRFTTADVISFLNYVQDEIQQELGFQKKRATLDLTGDFAFTKNELNYYDLPDDFMYLDFDEGIMVDGIRYHGTSDAEIDMFQEKAVAGPELENDYNDDIITVDDYMDESQTGMLKYYSIDWKDQARVTAGKSGYLLYIIPNVNTGQVVTYTYMMLPDQFVAGGAQVSLLVRNCEEVLVYGGLERCAEQALFGGIITQNVYDTFKALYDRKMLDCIKFYMNMKTPDKDQFAKTAKQVYNSNNSMSSDSRRVIGYSEGY